MALVQKTGDVGLRGAVKWEQARRKQRADRDKHAEAVRECGDLLARPEVQEALAHEPHPNSILSSVGKTMADYYGFIISNSSKTHIQKIAKTLRRLAAAAA